MGLRIRSSSIMAWNSSRLLSPPSFLQESRLFGLHQKGMINHAQLTVRRKKCFGSRSAAEVDVDENDCRMWMCWLRIWTYLVYHALTTNRLVSLDTETCHYTLSLFLQWPQWHLVSVKLWPWDFPPLNFPNMAFSCNVARFRHIRNRWFLNAVEDSYCPLWIGFNFNS